MAVEAWSLAKRVIGDERVTLGPQASQQWLHAPEHLAMVLARYRAAAALIGNARDILELGCGEGIGTGILLRGGRSYYGVDSDGDALRVAAEQHQGSGVHFQHGDILDWRPYPVLFDAAVSLDVIEHIPQGREDDFMLVMSRTLMSYGACVIGTPSANAAHLASPQSRAGHINLYWPERLRDLMARHFHTVQMLYMQDTALHLGHPAMAHYIISVGVGPR